MKMETTRYLDLNHRIISNRLNLETKVRWLQAKNAMHEYVVKVEYKAFLCLSQILPLQSPSLSFHPPSFRFDQIVQIAVKEKNEMGWDRIKTVGEKTKRYERANRR